MALHDGFFDSRYDEDIDEYDRAYDVEAFLTYFDQIVGSGVCVYQNESSYAVRLEGRNAVVSPGYLFITGHWLKNDADYEVSLAGDGIQAVVAHLNTSAKRIDIEARDATQSYQDSLVLALVNMETGTVEDTRYNLDLCGVIEPAGELSSRLEFCLRYIDNQIQPKLDKAKEDITAQAKKLDKAIANVSAEIDKIVPPAIGSIKFSAAMDIGEEWLKCDGSFILESEYPELVKTIRGLPGSGVALKTISSWMISDCINNGCFFDSFFWTYDKKGDGKIFRVSLADGSVSSVSVFLPEGTAYLNFYRSTLSIVRVNGKNIVYLFPDGKETESGDALNIVYYCFEGFSTSQTSVTLEKKTIAPSRPTSNGIEIEYRVNDKGPMRNIFSYRPVFVYDSVPYVYLEIGAWSHSKDGGSYFKFFTLASLSGDGEFLFYEVKSPGGDELTFAYLYSNGIPADEKSGGFYIAYTNSTNEMFSVKGNERRLIGRTNNSLYTDARWSITNSPAIITENYVLVSAVGSTNYGDITTVTVDGIALPDMTTRHAAIQAGDGWGFLLDKAGKNVLYLHDLQMCAILTNKGIIFTKNPWDAKQYAFISTVETFGEISPTSFSVASVEYDELSRKIYIVWEKNNYYVDICVVELPENFDPANGAELPKLSMAGVPAYIKAKKAEGEA